MRHPIIYICPYDNKVLEPYNYRTFLCSRCMAHFTDKEQVLVMDAFPQGNVTNLRSWRDVPKAEREMVTWSAMKVNEIPEGRIWI